MSICYNANTHSCTGECQGASNCLLAKYFRGEIKKPTPEEMRKYELKSLEYSKWFEENILNNKNFNML